MSLGFVDPRFCGGFESIWAVDIDKAAVATYAKNFGDHASHADIETWLADGQPIPEADVVVGGPPCQGFSLLNKKRNGDIRRQLWQPYMDIVAKSKAKIFVIENVAELHSSPEFNAIKARAKSLGFDIVNRIRKQSGAVQEKILAFFRENVGHPVTSEELRYVANNKTEWARRTRELRTDEGWPIVTRYNGDPNLPVGVYVLERDEQLPKHDRQIPELIRREVMERDRWACRWKNCGWSNAKYANDKRYLEVHHVEHYAKGGTNDPENLVTLCNLHHDQVHKTNKLEV